MTQEQQTVLLIKGVISELPTEERDKIMAVYAQIQDIIKDDSVAAMAVALIGAELAASC